METKYKGFILDPFQVESVECIEKNHSVVVSAATGTGKTLVADYIIDKAIKAGKRVIYTAPIKALSNQKFRDFRKEYGDRVGLLTGDISINERAPILVMTTEIYRNMLMSRDATLEELSYVVFDEIHFINDIERGTVWEESIIFSPPYVRFLCLSATIPNAKQFAQWIQSIQGHTVDVVIYDKRAVPLKHYGYEHDIGLFEIERLPEIKELLSYPSYDRAMPHRRNKRFKENPTAASHLDIIDEIRDGKMPCIFFVFSRKACYQKAQEASQRFDFTTKQEKEEIISRFNKIVPPEVRSMDSARAIKRYLTKGIGVHNAGVLPNLKEIVEVLFNDGLIKILYATETFAVGINMPAKTVCFNSLEKYDGISFRYLHSKEYFQMAGRAGRRGIDKEGNVIILIDKSHMDLNKVINLCGKDIEPIISQFRVSYNTVLNLKKHYPEKTIEKLLKSNFGYFVMKTSKKQVRIMATYQNMVRKLKQEGYLKDGFLTEKGEFATYIYTNELLISELMFTGVFKELSIREINILVGSIAYEPRGADRFRINHQVGQIMNKINKNMIIRKGVSIMNIKRVYHLFDRWSKGCEFEELLDLCSIDEGNIIRLFRHAIDILKQIRKATTDQQMGEKLTECIGALDRDIVEVKF
ncbi:hypothetical protein COV93_08960 [Candidatus Woesearchaeota archaeon CG11_big_fil_rev_8_21_14_0_20_43_8]|nr:MAG: hypothetical protein COV93_08960 [Candidatus Woesearchaeota archaeon CG11_big_fil_rev_8_21_14_0_20_43_8]